MRIFWLTFSLLVLIANPLSAKDWKLVWSDEFNYQGLPDPAKWGFETGFIRNHESQYYTQARPENARVESGHLTEAEMERLGEALSDLHVALAQIKEEHGVTDAVAQVRDGLDELVDEVVDRMINPERWREEAAATEA